MKLLFDQNISAALVGRLSDLYPESTHVKLVGLAEADDDVVWEHARKGGYVLVSKDSDFHQRSLLFGAPPKVVWLRIGNCRTKDVENLLRMHSVTIHSIETDLSQSLLILSTEA
jgi:predicted nuclease of predicted toxin-antitoxin system